MTLRVSNSSRIRLPGNSLHSWCHVPLNALVFSRSIGNKKRSATSFSQRLLAKLHRYWATIRGSMLLPFLVYFAVSLSPFRASRQPKCVSFYLLSCDCLSFRYHEGFHSVSRFIAVKSRSRLLRLIVKLLSKSYFLSLNVIWLPSCDSFTLYLVVCKIVVNVFGRYDNSCYRLSLQYKYQLSRLSHAMVSLIYYKCSILLDLYFIPYLRERILNYRFSGRTYLYHRYIYLCDYYIYLYHTRSTGFRDFVSRHVLWTRSMGLICH